MILFLTILYYLSVLIGVISLLLIIYEAFKKSSSFKGLALAFISFSGMFILDYKISQSIRYEVIKDIKSGILVLEKNQILNAKDIIGIQYSSQKKYFNDNKFFIKVSAGNDSLILKKDQNSKIWLFYTKYYFSKIHPIGYLKIK